MTFTYCSPKDSDKDAVRFRIGDTDSNDPLLQDEEIEYLLENEGGAKRAAAVAALTISAKYSRLADEAVGQVKVSYSQKSKQYSSLADKLSDAADSALAMPYAGGISISDKTTREDDTDRVSPFFERKIQDASEVFSDKLKRL